MMIHFYKSKYCIYPKTIHSLFKYDISTLTTSPKTCKSTILNTFKNQQWNTRIISTNQQLRHCNYFEITRRNNIYIKPIRLLHSTSTHHARKTNPESMRTPTAPPLHINSTGSPQVYVASCSLEEEYYQSLLKSFTYANHSQANDDDDYDHHHQSIEFHPNQLFQNIGQSKHSLFSNKHNRTFQYISPKLFNYELPKDDLPKVAFLGRSNVGKSSLINSLTGVKNLARTSKTPGRTQQLNYFGLFTNTNSSSNNSSTSTSLASSSPIGYFIDLPGYGFANAPSENVDSWQQATQILLNSQTVTRLFLLVDARRGLTLIDSTIMNWLEDAQIPFSIVLTKSDCVSKPKLIRFVNEVGMRFHHSLYGTYANEDNENSLNCFQSPFIFVTSSTHGKGINELLWFIAYEFTHNKMK